MCIANLFIYLPALDRWLTTMYSEVRRWSWPARFYIIRKLVAHLIPSCCSMAGKCNRGLSVVDSYKLLKGADVLSEEEMFLACTLGWCIEWVLFSPQFLSGRMAVKQLIGSSKNTMVFTASSFLSGAWWYHGWLPHSSRPALLVQGASG